MEADQATTVHVSLLQKGAKKLGLESAHRNRYTIGIICVLFVAVLVIAAILCAPAVLPLANTSAVAMKSKTKTRGQIQPPKGPNVVFIMPDDLGWGNVGYHNPENVQINTPNIDELAVSGLQLNRMYVYRGCSPSRSSFQTGRLPVHVTMDNGDGGITNPSHGIPSEMTGFAEKLREADYKTYLFGKWDAGFANWKQMPTARGWDTFYGYLGKTIDYFVKTSINLCPNMDDFDLWNNDKPAFASVFDRHLKDQYIEFELRDRVLEVLDAHSGGDDPFFIFYSSHLPHYPAQIPEEYLIDDPYDDDTNFCSDGRFDFVFPGFDDEENYPCRTITQSQVNLLDEIVGDIVAKLKDNDQWENTLLIFQSDNGGDIGLSKAAGNNYPLRGGKKTDFEGGVRAVTFLNGGYLPRQQRGKIDDGMMHIADWYTTFSAMVGVDPADSRAASARLPDLDGLDMWPWLMGEVEDSPRTELVLSEYSVIENDFKYFQGRLIYSVWGDVVWPTGDTPTQDELRDTILDCSFHGCLFNLAKDPEERIDVAGLYPETTLHLKTKLVYEKSKFWVHEVDGVRLAEQDSCPEDFELVVDVGTGKDSGVSLPCGCWMAMNNYNNFDGPYQGLDSSQKSYIPDHDHEKVDYSDEFGHDKVDPSYSEGQQKQNEKDDDGEEDEADDELQSAPVVDEGDNDAVDEVAGGDAVGDEEGAKETQRGDRELSARREKFLGIEPEEDAEEEGDQTDDAEGGDDEMDGDDEEETATDGDGDDEAEDGDAVAPDGGDEETEDQMDGDIDVDDLVDYELQSERDRVQELEDKLEELRDLVVREQLGEMDRGEVRDGAHGDSKAGYVDMVYLAIICVLAVLLLGMCGAFWWWYNRRSSVQKEGVLIGSDVAAAAPSYGTSSV